MLQKETRLALPHDGSIPVLGLGVWQMADGEETIDAVRWALDAGYRHIDTATLYANEASVGRAVLESGIPREEVFVTTKLWPTDAFDAEAALMRSLRTLGFEYVDLYLIHHPVPLFGDRVWRMLEELQARGLARAVGVSNYSLSQLQELLRIANVIPAVNQIEMHPFSYDRALVDFCRKEGIVVEAYSPLSRGLHLDDATVVKLAMRYGKSPAQLMLRWALQKDAVVIPKSSRREHIIENADIFSFEIDGDDMRRLDTLHAR